MASKIFHSLFDFLSGIKTDKGIVTYAIYNRKTVNVLTSMREHYRETHILSSWIGFNTIKVPIKHAKREVGHTSYNFKKSVNLAFGAMFAYSDKPLKFDIVADLFFSFSSLVYGVYIFVRVLLGLENVKGRSSLIFSIWFMGGIVLLFLGIDRKNI